jgi:hypothetical protein
VCSCVQRVGLNGALGARVPWLSIQVRFIRQQKATAYRHCGFGQGPCACSCRDTDYGLSTTIHLHSPPPPCASHTSHPLRSHNSSLAHIQAPFSFPISVCHHTSTRLRRVTYLHPTMSARAPQGQRPGGSRFAQFKLVLLGMSKNPADLSLWLTLCRRVCCWKGAHPYLQASITKLT